MYLLQLIFQFVDLILIVCSKGELLFFLISSILNVALVLKSTSTVCRHLTKLFDSMARLKFVPGEVEGTKSALGMHAKDGEYVEFNHDCDCSGPVSRIYLFIE